MAVLGTVLLFSGVVVFCLYAIDVNRGLPMRMPDFWAKNLTLWPFVGLIFSVCGGVLLKTLNFTPATQWIPSIPGPRFRSAVLYTRTGCHLCDDAKLLLESYRTYLPELIEVDIDTDPELAERFGESIPVVAFDDQIRFQGQVNETLLQRLLEGTSPLPMQLPVLPG